MKYLLFMLILNFSVLQEKFSSCIPALLVVIQGTLEPCIGEKSNQMNCLIAESLIHLPPPLHSNSDFTLTLKTNYSINKVEIALPFQSFEFWDKQNYINNRHLKLHIQKKDCFGYFIQCPFGVDVYFRSLIPPRGDNYTKYGNLDKLLFIINGNLATFKITVCGVRDLMYTLTCI